MEEEFDLIRSIYGSCAFSCFWLGILLNIFLIWLILKRTPAPMQIYNKLLLAPCFMCILIAFTTFFVQPIPIVEHGFHAVIQNGLVRHLPQPWNYTANVAWFQLLLMFLCCTTVQFAFRFYMMMSRDGKIPLKMKYLTAFAIYLLLVAHVALHYWSDYPYDEYMPNMVHLARQVHSQIGIGHIRFSSFTVARSWSWMLHCIAMILMFAVCYWIIVICALKTHRHIGELYGKGGGQTNGQINGGNGKDGDKKRRKKRGDKRVTTIKVTEIANQRKQQRMHQYNAQVTTAFIVQAVLPTIEVIELTVQTTLPIFFQTESTIHWMIYAAIPLYFIPVLNPLATMLLVKPYQMAVLKMLGLNDMNGKQKRGSSGFANNGNGYPQKQQIDPQPYSSSSPSGRYIASPQAIQPMFTIT